jgi:hypothetical protein
LSAFLSTFLSKAREIKTLFCLTAILLDMYASVGNFCMRIVLIALVGIAVLCGVAWLLFRTGREGTERLDWMAFIMY